MPYERSVCFASALSHPLFVGERACSSRCTEYCHSHNHLKSTTIPCSAPPHLPPLSKGGGLTARHKLCFVAFCLRYAHHFYIANFSAVKTEGLHQLHRMLLLPQPSQKHYRLLPTSTLPKPHYPSPRTKLASLVKGRWIDGKTQTVALLLCACDMPTIFILQTFLPSRRRDCISCTECCYSHNHLKSTTAFCPHQPSQNRTIPRLALNLPPLSKGGGLTVRHKPKFYSVFI